MLLWQCNMAIVLKLINLVSLDMYQLAVYYQNSFLRDVVLSHWVFIAQHFKTM